VKEPIQSDGELNLPRVIALSVLVSVVLGIIGVAFRGSWGALRDAALSAYFDGDGADLYPFAVDGLLIVAIISGVMLRHDRGARRYCLGIIISYTGASWLINYLHGLGTFAVNPATHARPVPPWYVVMLIAALLIGSIFLGSHLLIFVWRHIFPSAAGASAGEPAGEELPDADDDVPPIQELPAGTLDAAKQAYRKSLHPALKTLSQADLVSQYRLSKREAGQVQREVKAERDAEETEDVPPEPEQNGQVKA
jgi:hypothetical protein